MTKTKWCGLWLAVMAGAAGAQVLPAALDETPASPVATPAAPAAPAPVSYTHLTLPTM